MGSFSVSVGQKPGVKVGGRGGAGIGQGSAWDYMSMRGLMDFKKRLMENGIIQDCAAVSPYQCLRQTFNVLTAGS